MARAIILISVLIALAMAVRAQPNQLSCSIDSDCACGVNKTNGDCAYGNYRYIDTRRQCPGMINLRVDGQNVSRID